MSVQCFCVFPLYFRFLCGPYCMTWKYVISSSQNLLPEALPLLVTRGEQFLWSHIKLQTAMFFSWKDSVELLRSVAGKLPVYKLYKKNKGRLISSVFAYITSNCSLPFSYSWQCLWLNQIVMGTRYIVYCVTSLSLLSLSASFNC
jgi:hypothetical protein